MGYLDEGGRRTAYERFRDGLIASMREPSPTGSNRFVELKTDAGVGQLATVWMALVHRKILARGEDGSDLALVGARIDAARPLIESFAEVLLLNRVLKNLRRTWHPTTGTGSQIPDWDAQKELARSAMAVVARKEMELEEDEEVSPAP